jgi:hypothetical protein
LDVDEFREKWSRYGGSFLMGVSEITFTRALLGKVRTPYYVTYYNIGRLFMFVVNITFVTKLANLTPWK